MVKKRKYLEQCPKMLKLSIQRNYIVKNVFRLDCVEALSQGEIQTGSGTVTESGKVRESHRLDQEQLSRGDTQIGSVTETESGKVTDWTRNS